MLDALHRAQRIELRTFVDTLPLCAGDRVLDVACGDGTFTSWLAERARHSGLVVGLDASSSFLACASARLEGNASADLARTLLARGDAEQLPFADESFDLTFCAHSLQTLEAPAAAVREMARVTKAGGSVAILENDELAHILLPWPPEVQLAIDRCLALSAAATGDTRPFIGRRLGKLLADQGLLLRRFETLSVCRQGPLGSADREYFVRFLEHRRQAVEPFLSGVERDLALAFLSPAGIRDLADDPRLTVAFVHVAAIAEKRPGRGGRAASGH